jgi:hypothetical protein
VIVYVPGTLVFGMISPVELFKDNPAVDEKEPPGVPLKFTACGVLTETQIGV